MPIPREKDLRSNIVFSNVFENFHSRNNALWDLSKVCQHHEQKIPEASGPYRFQKSQKEYVKNLSEVYRKQNDHKNGLLKSDLKSAKSTIFGRGVPKEWDLIFYQLYRFQKMPSRIRHCSPMY